MHLLCNSFLVCLTYGKNNHNKLEINLLQHFPPLRKIAVQACLLFHLMT